MRARTLYIGARKYNAVVDNLFFAHSTLNSTFLMQELIHTDV